MKEIQTKSTSTHTAECDPIELQRERIHGLTIITYDELFMRLERLIELIEGARPAPPPL